MSRDPSWTTANGRRNARALRAAHVRVDSLWRGFCVAEACVPRVVSDPMTRGGFVITLTCLRAERAVGRGFLHFKGSHRVDA